MFERKFIQSYHNIWSGVQKSTMLPQCFTLSARSFLILFYWF